MNRVRMHERRLRAAFQRALLIAMAPAAALQGCGDDTVVPVPGADAGDATTSDVTVPGEGGSDATGPAVDSGEGEAAPRDAAAPDGDSGRTGADAGVTDASDAASADGEDDDGSMDASEEPSPWCADASVGTPYWPDGGGNCRYLVDLSCAGFAPTAGCFLSGSDCLKVCSLNTPLFDCEYAYPACTVAGRFVAEAGQPVTINCDLCPGAGRRPPGLRGRRAERARSLVGEYFAQAAYLEAASVHAFEHVARELRAHGAPRGLVAAAERSARDEVRHARVMGAFAARHGAAVAEPRTGATPVRSLEEIARENAVEGCVRETYGAVLATWQAARARDAGLRRALRRIAADETRHAALAWAIADWVEGLLDPAGRGRVARARRDARRQLRAEVARERHPDLAGYAGLPAAGQARALLAVTERRPRPDHSKRRASIGSSCDAFRAG